MKRPQYNAYDNVYPELEKLAWAIRKVMAGFETIDEMLAENVIRVQVLRKVGGQCGNRHYLQLAEKLENCNPVEPCGSMACSLCQRTRRLKFMQKWLPYIKERQDEYKAVTLIFYMDMLPNNKLFGWKYDALKERVRKAISRIGFSGPVIGGFEMDYHNYTHDPDVSHWMPHYHLLVPNEPEKIEQLGRVHGRGVNSKGW